MKITTAYLRCILCFQASAALADFEGQRRTLRGSQALSVNDETQSLSTFLSSKSTTSNDAASQLQQDVRRTQSFSEVSYDTFASGSFDGSNWKSTNLQLAEVRGIREGAYQHDGDGRRSVRLSGSTFHLFQSEGTGVDVSQAAAVQVSFSHFHKYHIEGNKFHLDSSYDGGATWQTQKTWSFPSDFVNEGSPIVEAAEFDIVGTPQNMLLSFRQEAARFGHRTFIDAIRVSIQQSASANTANPTKSPTDAPTRTPTAYPTTQPTITTVATTPPTLNPTKEPSSNPTKSPTRNPTPQPTTSPTKQATVDTSSPTESPTKRLTSDPTESPTKRPTSDPSRSPSRLPTRSPTPPTGSQSECTPSLDTVWFDNFETAWGHWTGGGEHAYRIQNKGAAWDGKFSIRLRREGPEATMTLTHAFSTEGKSRVHVTFGMFARDMGTGHYFVLESNQGSGWSEAAKYEYGASKDFENLEKLQKTAEIDITEGTDMRLRFQMYGDVNFNHLFLDAVDIQVEEECVIPDTLEPSASPSRRPTPSPVVPATLAPSVSPTQRPTPSLVVPSTKATGQVCSSHSECTSSVCRNGACMESAACYPLRHQFGTAFDNDQTINIVIVGSKFDIESNPSVWLNQVQSTVSQFDNYNIFAMTNTLLNVFYVDEPGNMEPSYCNYGCSGIQRLLCCNAATAKSLAHKCFSQESSVNFQTLVIHNDAEYGGAGNMGQNLASTSIHIQAPQMAIHELGHSMLDLADEYTTGNGNMNKANCDDLQSCPKWNDMVGNVPDGYGNVQCVAGCNQGSYGMSNSCTMMKSLGCPFEAVNTRFSCCSFFAVTKQFPNYCADFEGIGGKSLLEYCQLDYQGYGSAAYLPPPSHRLLLDDAANPSDHGKFVTITEPHVIVELTLLGRERTPHWTTLPGNTHGSTFRKPKIFGDFESMGDASVAGETEVIRVVVNGNAYIFRSHDVVDVPPMENVVLETAVDEHDDDDALLEREFIDFVLVGESELVVVDLSVEFLPVE